MKYALIHVNIKKEGKKEGKEKRQVKGKQY